MVRSFFLQPAARAAKPATRSTSLERLEDLRLLTLTVQTLDTFGNRGADGSEPQAGLTADGSTLFGTASDAGAGREGAIYSVNDDGTDLQPLYSFGTVANDGRDPVAGLTLVGGTLYGTTVAGGANDEGTIFSINTNGSDYQILHSFTGTATDGFEPMAGLTLVGSTLYGTASGGGADSYGVVFSINTANDPTNTGFQILHSFAGALDGNQPTGTLALVGSTLFGTTSGGTTGNGTVYSINLGNDDYSVVHNFSPSDGYAPSGGLTLVSSTLFGTAFVGGADGFGTIYSIDLTDDNFSVVRSFTGGTADGENPGAGLTLAGNTLYGTTVYGGSTGTGLYNGDGTLFSIGTNGGGYQLVHSFTDSPDGSSPAAGLTLVGSTLYGTTEFGGNTNTFKGTIYAVLGVAPTVTPSGNPASYAAGSAPVTVDPGVTVTSSDADITGATETINNDQSGDTLNFTSPAGSGISGSFSTGVLTLSGTATPAQYTAALQSVTFSSTSSSTVTRSISVAANDGNLGSSQAPETVNFSSPVTITATYVSSTAWNSTFLSYLGSHTNSVTSSPYGNASYGYALQTGSSSAQLETLPWLNLNTITVSFSGAVQDIGQGSLELVGGSGGSAPAVTGFASLGNSTYQWTLASPLTNNRYVFAIATTGSSFGTAGSTQVVDSSGAGISGTFSTGQNFPSGNGVASTAVNPSTFDFFFNVLPGDINRDTNDNGTDLNLLRPLAINTRSTSSSYNPYYDVNGDATINGTDLSLIRPDTGRLASGSPTAPTVSGVGGLSSDLALGVIETTGGSSTGPAPAVANVIPLAASSTTSSAAGDDSSDTNSTGSTLTASSSQTANNACTDQALSDFDLTDLLV